MTKGSLETSLPPHILPEETANIEEFYRFHKQIGKGTFGIVWECEHLDTGTRVVCKGIPKSKLRSLKDVTEVRNEVFVMKRLAGHPNIVFLVDAFENSEYVYMVMEYCTEGELFDKIIKVGHYPEAEAAFIFYEIALAVHHCQTHNILHRDLKPENFFLVPVPEGENSLGFRVKLGDFGLSVILEDGKTSGTSGSKVYQSPEQLSGREYDLKSDMWSLGVVLYVLLCGDLPFSGRTKLDIVEEIMDRGLTFHQEAWSTVSDGAKNLLSRLLVVEPAHRASSSQVLEDPWLVSQLPHLPSPDPLPIDSPLSKLRVQPDSSFLKEPSQSGSLPSEPSTTAETPEIFNSASESSSVGDGNSDSKKQAHQGAIKSFFRPFFHKLTHPRAKKNHAPESSETPES